MKGLKSIIFAAAALITAPAVITSCDDWTEPEAKDYYTPPTEGYYNNLKDYFKSPHKVMFGWFGSWTGSAKANSLIGLPDSTDFVSLWLVWGNLTPAQQADLKAFQARGSKAILCWRAGNIGDNLTPGGNDQALREEFWGFTTGDPESCKEAAKKYALAIVDTCVKYGINGFDYDMEDDGSLMDFSNPEIPNTFMRTLREEFDKHNMMLVADIPGAFRGEVGSSGDPTYFRYFKVLDDDVLTGLDYIIWQTYELDHSGLDWFFDRVKLNRPELFPQILAKSIVTATFERASDKYLFPIQSTWEYKDGLPHAGQGAYHIEYDYPGNPDYPTVRKGIATQNPPIRN